ncbi:MAG: DUF4349 domain-containing protein [Firmicutes bacterium]|nr:DUF4349 domain-containing protein [Bacillota bacterium]
MNPGKKKRIFYFAALLIFFTLFVTGCGAADKVVAPSTSKQMVDQAYDVDTPEEAQSSANYAEDAGDGAQLQGSAPEGISNDIDSTRRRHMILSAHLTLEVEDIERAADDIQSVVNELDGYVASLQFYDLTRERRIGQISIRVPEDKYEHALEMIDELGNVKSISENTKDVTMQYIDLEARIANMEAQEERMRELLERAETIGEIMEIERELGRIRGSIESMSGEFKYLRERVNYSSINIGLEEKDPRTEVIIGGFDNFREKVVNQLALNSNRFLVGAANLLIVLIGSLPILAPILLIIFCAWKIAVFIKIKKEKFKNKKVQ